MPWKLIGFFILLTLIVVFAGFNLSNVSDISFGIVTLHDVPVFLSLSAAFLLGAGLTIIGVLASRSGSKRTARKEKPALPGKRRKNERDAAETETGF